MNTKKGVVSADLSKDSTDKLRATVSMLQEEIEGRWKKEKEKKLELVRERYRNLGAVLTKELIDNLTPEHDLPDCEDGYDYQPNGLISSGRQCPRCCLIDLMNNMPIDDETFELKVVVE